MTADIHVFWTSLAGIAVVLAIDYGQNIQREQERVCAQELNDGRRLISHHLGPLGHERCTYEPPKFKIATKPYVKPQ